ncbi:MAG: DNA helicase RecQ [Saprospiraceae bacterium]|uniref:DNA helicase RecQ n=1 Tax=Candidatus Opimibacter skivensis TaxID=2982028 RepID=A0A9D7SSA3_9BACT|nr:DNA helicase RecQ [Candidatus Opimibacter skivensis]
MSSENLNLVLKSRFGFDHFREHQEEIIRHVLNGGHGLVIMPTGGGKSICYQLPALLRDGFALVISPLISLMNDQVRSLRANGIIAGALHSGTTGEESKTIHENIKNGSLKILFISPERALTPKFLDFLRDKMISLIAIDEAHCVSIWGNDFRPEYAQLTTLIEIFNEVPVLALTATADKATQEDIRQQLKLRNPKTFLSSFERPNIHLSVRPGIQRLDQIKEFLQEHKGQPGIIYCLARKTTESIAGALVNYGYKAAAYHAEIDNYTRKKVQEDFQFDRLQIVCATIAFGMGIDKPNIRWIIHYNLPKNIESYYQEVGRSGRDGQEAEAVMFYSYRDVAVYKEFIQNSDADETFKRVQSEKLDRILEYSQATNCRTNVILNYFGEYRSANCGHCDHCQNPLQGFDGTKITQMALSACKRCNESIGINLLVEVLRGSGKREIYDRHLHEIKTYGAGKDITFKDWNHYITQLINQGYLEIDYTRHSILICTPLSDAVLYDRKQVTLHRQIELPEEPIVQRKSKSIRFKENLLDRLEELRDRLAKEDSLPSYSVFPLGTLKEIAEVRPYTVEEFSKLNGVGEYKSAKYGQEFVETIRSYMTDQNLIKKPKGITYVETLELFRQGMTVADIATKRGMAVSTIAMHLAKLYLKGEEINLQQFLLPGDLDMARQGWRASGFSDQASKVKEQVGDSLNYERLNFALAILKREKALKENN